MASRKTGIEALSDRQKEILVLISQGYQQKEIAGLLGIEPSTIRGHTEEARQKIGVSSTRAAARLYVASLDFVPLRQNDGGTQIRVAAPDDPASRSDHEHTNFADDNRTLLDNPQERFGGGHPVPDSPLEAGQYRPYTGDDLPGEKPGRRDSGSDAADVRHDRVGRYLIVANWLKNLNLIQWTGLTLLTTLFIILITGSAVIVLLGIFQAITQISGQTG
jgi:DNA-binding CsgD family transcriptional regulator